MPAQEPFISMWLGNFFEPFYSDADATRRAVKDIADLGFTSLNLDSKPWEDFFDRYAGGEASQYVGMQELMIAEAAERGLDVTCLALYLCGDNLYPTIRDVPPRRGEEAVRPDGSPMGTYTYFSPRAQASMVEHVEGLLRLYGDRMRRMGDGRILMQTMFDPIPKPSFDAGGRAHYLGWLAQRYDGDIGRLNARYDLAATSFESLEAQHYWLRPQELTWVGCALPTAADFADRTPDFYRWVDNQSYLGDVGLEYFRVMREHWRSTTPPLFVEPVLHQWGYAFNPPGETDWQTGQRALDIYRIAKHVDGVLFIAAPLDAENKAEASVVSLETSIARTANEHRPFTAGLYLGRHISGDIYRDVPPAEAMATQIAGGATRFHIYGYSGLDDGGVLSRMDEPFRTSLRDGVAWAKQVIPLLGERDREVALLFPAEMSFFEPAEVDEGGRHRMDLLGWYQQLVDLGWNVDLVHPDQVRTGALVNYQHLVLPTNSLYDLSDGDGVNGNAALEREVRAFAQSGGNVLHGPGNTLALRAFGLSEREVPFDVMAWDEPVIPHGWSTVAYSGPGEVVGTYLQSGETALMRTSVGNGAVHSFGFQYGYSYSRRTMPIVPPRYGKSEMHPVVLLRSTPVEQAIGRAPHALITPTKGVEVARFGSRAVVVNHRSSAIDLRDVRTTARIALDPTREGYVAAHSAVYLDLDPTASQGTRGAGPAEVEQ